MNYYSSRGIYYVKMEGGAGGRWEKKLNMKVQRKRGEDKGENGIENKGKNCIVPVVSSLPI